MYCNVVRMSLMLFVTCGMHHPVTGRYRSTSRIQIRKVRLKPHPNSMPNTVAGEINKRERHVLFKNFMPWSAWSRCTRKCLQYRRRKCRRPEVCGQAVLKEKRPCRRHRRKQCSSSSYKIIGFRHRQQAFEQILYNLIFGSWSPWGPCTRSCRRRRTRYCKTVQFCRHSYMLEERKCVPRNNSCGKRGRGARARQKQRQADNLRRRSQSMVGGSTRAPEVTKYASKCGMRMSKRSGASYRIVGGRWARAGSWPWQVAIMTRWKEQYCGGTLIAPQWVLTAAHCVRKKHRRRKVIVRVGEFNFAVHEGPETDFRRITDHPHPGFDYDTISNDIALLHLPRPVTLSSSIQYACLPSPEDVLKPGKICYTVGWGKIKNGNLYGADVLREAEVPIVQRKRCRKSFSYDIADTQMCAGYRRGGVDSCAGDSGGPLMCSRKMNGVETWYVAGVTSYGEGCGDRGKFGIYTNVSAYLKWIYRTVT